MKKLIDIKREPKKGDVLVFDGVDYTPIPKDIFLNEIFILRKDLENVKKELHQIKGQILFDEGNISEEEFLNGKY